MKAAGEKGVFCIFNWGVVGKNFMDGLRGSLLGENEKNP